MGKLYLPRRSPLPWTMLLVTAIVGLSHALEPNGKNVCRSSCMKTVERSIAQSQPCRPRGGFFWFSRECTVYVQQPIQEYSTCFHCCPGWAQSDLDNCDRRIGSTCPTGGSAITTCADLPSGVYQWCHSCSQYAQCDQGHLTIHQCPKGHYYDDNKKGCHLASDTCHNVDSTTFVPTTVPPTTTTTRHVFIDGSGHGSDTDDNEVDSDLGFIDAPLTCNDLYCPPPTTCLMLYGDDEDHPQARCICPPGLRSIPGDVINCEDINECQEANPCVHGTCRNRYRTYTCKCRPHWVGRRCDVKAPKKRIDEHSTLWQKKIAYWRSRTYKPKKLGKPRKRNQSY